MTEVLQQLVDLLALERIEVNLFRGHSQDLGWGQVFGGQVLGQALSAATQTVPEDRYIHSLHGYFLLLGDVNTPIVYDVERIRDGGSFTTRRVVAIQHGRPIFSMSASFQKAQPGYDHQDEMPDVKGPEGLLSQVELSRRIADQIPTPLRERFTADSPIEIRPVRPMNYLKPTIREPESAAWYKSAGTLPDTPGIHQSMAAYASDFNFLATAMYPHGVSWLMPSMQVASLDHAMWFHRPFRFDDWLLHHVESPSASGGRGLVRGRMFNQKGELVASTAQEGLMRPRRKNA
ncbi:acyl-CoA thioesterase II [Bradymonadaceae bacterium TMQ3]|uniref:Acyl-CoA thioesterase II n=1 Tax=Lujinxingia sediminis TaxID=2480984 RepID=A0ABY0CSK3_9DELT|nr:acyl-CoA thioesterase II [Lujinxingia sediminis]RDV38286.1 acyl-CoA thioesterase II [Bradymonadaceae bacterium TMQ3]RVU43511.1 acyl-CoA thioesterase II [Lujinxingia sediminis]TXC75960.1 acyl-CoA thioesterase II [Bradymonadales bacterium TMQ1]